MPTPHSMLVQTYQKYADRIILRNSTDPDLRIVTVATGNPANNSYNGPMRSAQIFMSQGDLGKFVDFLDDHPTTTTVTVTTNGQVTFAYCSSKCETVAESP
jgi:hypothetical protein